MLDLTCNFDALTSFLLALRNCLHYQNQQTLPCRLVESFESHFGYYSLLKFLQVRAIAICAVRGVL